ncbi:hypothetical protein GCM10007874_27890 [Labrys miyagiensis]|uniref:Uncharacterized protein n=1 Tax=Labrys miyagiensis TaxID=346912 RepID=A0ABQ6CHG5_9HYPH|nr:hypothetical protein GCM10007874_27890 [Labrys miyagiensis]
MFLPFLYLWGLLKNKCFKHDAADFPSPLGRSRVVLQALISQRSPGVRLSCLRCFPTTTRKRSRSHALSGWVDEETGRWRLRGSREGMIMEDAGRTVGAGRHRPVPAARHADKARKTTCFFRLMKAEASRERMARTIRT